MNTPQGMNNPQGIDTPRGPHTATRLRFTKMHGLGNDFVVFDGVSQVVALSPEQCRRIADRHFGVGCDQILLVEKPSRADVDFRYRIFNADGSEVEQCGNGARCFVRFVHDKGLTEKTTIRVETASRVIEPRLLDNGLVTVDMGAPRFAPAAIPFIADAEALAYPLKVGQHTIEISALSMGNPHAVLRVNDLDSAPVDILGAAIESHQRFPQRVNAGFMQVLTPHDIRLRVYERGTGETLACGTGACAAAVAGIRHGWLKSPVSVHTRGGNLVIEWAGGNASVCMTGPAVTVFEGDIEL
jgi:diaminopimelate epimerase